MFTATELMLFGAFAVLAAGVFLANRRLPAPRPKQTRPANFSNIVLLSLALFLTLFILVMIVTFWVKGAVPDTLIQYTLGAGGVEAVVLAGIKVSKVVTREKPGESEKTE